MSFLPGLTRLLVYITRRVVATWDGRQKQRIKLCYRKLSGGDFPPLDAAPEIPEVLPRSMFSEPHRHQNVGVIRIITALHRAGACGVRESDLDRLSLAMHG